MKNVKKAFIIVIAIVLVVGISGCEKVENGNYKEGTYFSSTVDDYNNEKNTATATMYVDENGVIKSLVLDTTYTSGDTVTTKKALGNDYNMKTYNASAAGEWFEQIDKLEDAIVDAQGLDNISLDDEGYTDAVSGCTIKISALYTVVEDVLNQAKK